MTRTVYPLPVGWKLQDSPTETIGARDVVAIDQDGDDLGSWYAVTITRDGMPVRELLSGSKILIYRGPV